MSKAKALLSLEFLILCIVVPGYIIINRLAPFMFCFLYGACLYGYIILRLRYHETLKDIWKWNQVTWENLKPMILRWVLACIGMTIFLWLYDPARFFGMAIDRPHLIPFLLILYPLVSALPQEFIFCSFFFDRYKPLFGTGTPMIAASAITFAYAHVLYINPVAPTLSLLGGIIFAQTYYKTRSLALVTIEHGLYGNFLFLIGLGWYFYGGSVIAQG